MPRGLINKVETSWVIKSDVFKSTPQANFKVKVIDAHIQMVGIRRRNLLFAKEIEVALLALKAITYPDNTKNI
jgi:hypothetical protein